MLRSNPSRNTDALNGPPGGGRWGDGCFHVFLDVGANIGVQTRKLFEPHAYPSGGSGETISRHFEGNFSWVRAFESAFGQRRGRNAQRQLCAFGFEASPRHTKRLQQLQACYQKQGWRARFFTETAVSDVNGNATFFLARDQLAASLVRHGKHRTAHRTHTVSAIDLAAWIDEHVLQRGIRGGGGAEPRVLMKLDIEAAEFRVLGGAFLISR